MVVVRALVGLLAVWLSPLVCLAEDNTSSDPNSFAQFEQELLDRLKSDPEDSTAWRMLGHLRLERGDWTGALDALRRAVTLDQQSVAAWHDLGRVFQQIERPQDAQDAYSRVLELAPDTEYAMEALVEVERLQQAGGIQPTDYRIRSFDGSNVEPLVADPLLGEDSPWSDRVDLRFELGSQYNDNVSLAPSSRELLQGDPSSAQMTSAATVKWYLYDTETWRFGPNFDSDFTVNEGNLNRYNLQSYRPGAFLEGTLPWESRTLKPRVSYLFTHDEFDGSTFGNRHTLATSLGLGWNRDHTTTAFWSIDSNSILQDGSNPPVTSQDGVSNIVGLLHDGIRRQSRWRAWRVGADFQNVDTTGSNYRFRGVSLHTQSIFVLRDGLTLTLRGGWAYRDYLDFSFTPSRNTNIWRTGGELRQRLKKGFSIALVSQYDRFDSENEQYDSDRFLTGGLLTWEY